VVSEEALVRDATFLTLGLTSSHFTYHPQSASLLPRAPVRFAGCGVSAVGSALETLREAGTHVCRLEALAQVAAHHHRGKVAAVFRGALAEFLQGYRHAVLSLGQRAAERRRADAQAVHATRARQDVLDDLDALREMEDAAGGGGRAHRQDEGEGVGGAGRRSDGESVSLLELVVHTRALRGQLRDLASICGCAKEGKVGGGDGLEGGHILLDALFLRVEGQRGAGVQGTFLRQLLQRTLEPYLAILSRAIFFAS
ncbi:hypothetical protein T484DRAFT_1809508, partial [Baffinella frigidus]